MVSKFRFNRNLLTMQLLHYLENDLESGTCSSENLVIKIVVLKCFGLFNMAKLMCDLEG